MWGRVKDEFYGQALREIESGSRRDDLWGRALAKSGGSYQKAKAEYVNMLALQLEAMACAPIRRQKKQIKVFFIKRWSIRLAAIGCCLTLLGLYTAHWYRSYQLDWIAKVAVRDYQPKSEPQTVFVDSKGNRFLEPTWEQYYAVVVANDTGKGFDSFTEVQQDLAENDTFLIYSKYGPAAARLIGFYAEAMRVHHRATVNSPSFFQAMMDLFGFGAKSAR